MNGPGAAREPIARATRLIGKHKVISAAIALFAAAVITVSVATSGSAAPENHPAAAGFTLTTLGQPGKQVSLSQYKGKPVIVNFWASWCDPCQQETPLLASWYKQQHGHVVLLGLDENDTTAKALAFVKAKDVTYPIGFDPNVTVAGKYGVDGLPQTFFLNAKHQIVDHVLGALTKETLAAGVRQMNAAS
jgi:thiol-disulfide isomerase/thioredoxin